MEDRIQLLVKALDYSEDERPQFNTAQHLDADTARIRGELGYSEPVGLDEALNLSLAWEQEQQIKDAAASVENGSADG